MRTDKVILPTIKAEHQKHPQLSAAGFLERALWWLNSNSDVGIFYAALELRMCFERIWLNHGLASDNNSKNFFNLNWKPQQVRDELRKELSSHLDIDVCYVFTFNKSDSNLIMGYYLAMPQRLFESYGKLNSLLHAQWAIPINTPMRTWFHEWHNELSNFADDLTPHTSSRNSLITSYMPDIEHLTVTAEAITPILKSHFND